MSDPRVFIILVQYNGAKDTVPCLESLANLDYANHEIVLIDNASTNDSAALVRNWLTEHWQWPVLDLSQEALEDGPQLAFVPGRVTFCAASPNTGYAGGNNLGFRYAMRRGADFCWVLNNDTEVAPEALGRLVAAFGSADRAGVITPKIFFHARPTRIWFAGATIDYTRIWAPHWYDDEEDPGLTGLKETEFANGCAPLVSRACLERTGLFDPAYFVREEDLDYSIRARRSGFRLWVCNDALVWHKVGQSTGGPGRPSIWYYDSRNRLYLALHTLSFRQRLPFLAFFTVTRLLNFVRCPLTGRTRHMLASLRGTLDALRGRMGPAPATL